MAGQRQQEVICYRRQYCNVFVNGGIEAPEEYIGLIG